MLNALTRAVDALERTIADAREQRSLTYAEAHVLLQRIDLLHEQMEIVLVETRDYPDEEEDRET